MTVHPLADENPFDKFSQGQLKEIIGIVEGIRIK